MDVVWAGNRTTASQAGAVVFTEALLALTTFACPVLWAAVACANGVKDATEADVDCGGQCPTKCGLAKACGAAADCSSGSCVGGRCGAWGGWAAHW